VGMVAANKTVLARMERGGIAALSPASGLVTLSALLLVRAGAAASQVRKT
jgi:hypothetical protein